jgi:ABC-type nitrate/sulfonate/bicarbonate transport system substrate-binding protein
MPRAITLAAIAIIAGVVLPFPQASAQDTLKVATGQRGNWNAAIGELGQHAGIFKKHGLVLEILYTSGSGETQQAVISGAVDVGTAVGTMSAMSAFTKGAPIRVIGAETTGGADYWYVPASSSIKTMKDTDGKTIAYSTNGASTHGVVLAFIKELDLKAKPTATGSPASTLTQVMTGQVDVGWGSPPFGIKEIDENKIRVLAFATDLPVVRGQSIRVLATNADALAKRRDALTRYLDAYRETLDYMYSDNPQVIKDYAEHAGLPLEIAQRTRDKFFPKVLLNPDEIRGLDIMMPEAINLKFIAAPLTGDQLAELIQIPPRK